MFFEEKKEGVLLNVKLFPGMSKLAIKGLGEDENGQEYLKISVNSAPEKGKANAELISFLSKLVGVAKSDVKIVTGELSRYKKVLLNGNHCDILAELSKLEF